MKIEDLIKKIQSERKDQEQEIYNEEGLLRLQSVMREYSGEDRLVSWEEIAEDLKKNPPPKGYETGIKKLDELTGGFRKKQLITMFAHTKHGKTEVSLWLASLFPELSPVIIPLEQPAEELISQRTERHYSIPKFVSPRRNDPFVSTEWIEQRIVEGIAKYNTGMVVIDHLGYVDTLQKHAKENLAFRIGNIMKELSFMADKWNVCIFLLSHISEGEEAKTPQLVDLANSSDIKKESDTVIAIWRKNSMHKKVRVFENKTLLSVLANRRFGKNGNVGLVFNTDTGTFSEDNEWVEKMENEAELNNQLEA